jgi:hypothetical protein
MVSMVLYIYPTWHILENDSYILDMSSPDVNVTQDTEKVYESMIT